MATAFDLGQLVEYGITPVTGSFVIRRDLVTDGTPGFYDPCDILDPDEQPDLFVSLTEGFEAMALPLLRPVALPMVLPLLILDLNEDAAAQPDWKLRQALGGCGKMLTPAEALYVYESMRRGHCRDMLLRHDRMNVFPVQDRLSCLTFGIMHVADKVVGDIWTIDAKAIEGEAEAGSWDAGCGARLFLRTDYAFDPNP